MLFYYKNIFRVYPYIIEAQLRCSAREYTSSQTTWSGHSLPPRASPTVLAKSLHFVHLIITPPFLIQYGFLSSSRALLLTFLGLPG
jgi:hypothetical protein